MYFDGSGKGQDHGPLGCDTVWNYRREIKTSIPEDHNFSTHHCDNLKYNKSRSYKEHA